jgi:predicted TIM-barrel fold metal-dependent hydrolase
VPCYFANPLRPADWYRKRVGEFRALEISPAVHGAALSDERVGELVAVAVEAGHPVYAVCLIRPGAGVADLVALARRYRDGVFVLGHSGTGNIDFHAIELIADLPNILFETSGGYSSVLAEALRRLGRERLLFGTEYPLQHPDVELAKYRAVPVSTMDFEFIGRRNAHRVLSLEEQP